MVCSNLFHDFTFTDYYPFTYQYTSLELNILPILPIIILALKTIYKHCERFKKCIGIDESSHE